MYVGKFKAFSASVVLVGIGFILCDGCCGQLVNFPVAEVCRVRSGSGCGSGSLVGVRDGKELWLTNRHVAGGVGSSVTVETFDVATDAEESRPGRVVRASARKRLANQSADWSIIEVRRERLRTSSGHVGTLSSSPPSDGNFLVSVGCGRCDRPAGRIWAVNEVSDEKIYCDQGSVGGQSGSAVTDPDNKCVIGIITWNYGQYWDPFKGSMPERCGIQRVTQDMIDAVDSLLLDSP
jgi:hypothetical protein